MQQSSNREALSYQHRGTGAGRTVDPEQPRHRAALLGSLPGGGPQALELLVNSTLRNSTLRNSLLHPHLQYWETQPLMKPLSVLT